MASKSRKVLVPLTTLLAAGAVAVGSGATFTSTSGNTIDAVTSGTLTQSNSKDGGAILDLDNMKPGDFVEGRLSITNTGSLPANFSLTELASANGFSGSNLKLEIKREGATEAPVYSGTFGGLVDGTANPLGEFAAQEKRDYVFIVSLDKDTPNADQGKTASASFRWDAVQLDGQDRGDQ